MKHRNVNHARNILDRAVTILPRNDQFWFKFTYMEETLGNVAGARQIFERWMGWMPGEGAWMGYIRLELRYEEIGRARDIYSRFVECHPDPKNWLKWAKFEEDLPAPEEARGVYERAIEYLGDEHADQKVFLAFARFETRMQEYERARMIYTYGLERLPKSRSESLYNRYTQFEKQYGETAGMETVVLGRRRLKYEEAIKENSRNYDTWFDYARLEEDAGDVSRVREVYERAVSHVPPEAGGKRGWRRYIYLWIQYAIYEELEAQDPARARQVWRACLALIPHASFTFAKVWLMYAHFEVRAKDLAAARKALGQSLGRCAKARLYKGYIDLEMQLREFDRCRTLYAKFLQWDPANAYAWIRYTELERALGDTDRARALFELAVNQPVLDMPELLWKGYIDFEIESQEWDRARALYRRLLDRTGHVKVWVSFAQLEISAPPAETGVSRARQVLEEAYGRMRQEGLTTERFLLLEAWHDMEAEHGDESGRKAVEARMPKVVRKRRALPDSSEMEEYREYIFPDDETSKTSFKLLEQAQRWKRQRMESKGGEESAGTDH